MCSSEADFKTFDLAEPTLAFGFGDAVEEVVANLDQPVPLIGVWPEHRAAHACVLVDARCGERPPARPGRDLAPLEVAEEFLPFLVGVRTVFVVRLKLRRLKCEIPLLLQGNLGFGCGGVWLLPEVDGYGLAE